MVTIFSFDRMTGENREFSFLVPIFAYANYLNRFLGQRYSPTLTTLENVLLSSGLIPCLY